MNMTELLSNSVAQRIGWALVHFLWQGAAVALLLAGTLSLLRNRSAQGRWIVSCAALALMAVLPVATALMVSVEAPGPSEPAPTASPAVTPATADPDPIPAPSAVGPVEVPMESPSPPPPALAHNPGPSEATPPPAPPAQPAPTVQDEQTAAVSWPQQVQGAIQPVLPWAVLVWLAGAIMMSVWHFGGWLHVRRMRCRGTRPAGAVMQETFARMLQRLGVHRPVRLLESMRVAVPVVVGWLRPVILLPLGAVTALTPQQLEAILAHELAHIRRWDCLVQALATVTETLLFYHPAVWWVSRRIRQESEQCCDDLAVGICDDRTGYAHALAKVAELGAARRPAFAAAATGGMLLPRIRRLLGADSPGALSFGRCLSGALALVTIVAIGIAVGVSYSSGQAGEAGTVSTGAAQTDFPPHRYFFYIRENQVNGGVFSDTLVLTEVTAEGFKSKDIYTTRKLSLGWKPLGVLDGRLYAISMHSLLCIDLKTGRAENLCSSLEGVYAYDAGRLYAFVSDGRKTTLKQFDLRKGPSRGSTVMEIKGGRHAYPRMAVSPDHKRLGLLELAGPAVMDAVDPTMHGLAVVDLDSGKINRVPGTFRGQAGLLSSRATGEPLLWIDSSKVLFVPDLDSRMSIKLIDVASGQMGDVAALPSVRPWGAFPPTPWALSRDGGTVRVLFPQVGRFGIDITARKVATDDVIAGTFRLPEAKTGQRLFDCDNVVNEARDRMEVSISPDGTRAIWTRDHRPRTLHYYDQKDKQTRLVSKGWFAGGFIWATAKELAQGARPATPPGAEGDKEAFDREMALAKEADNGPTKVAHLREAPPSAPAGSDGLWGKVFDGLRCRLVKPEGTMAVGTAPTIEVVVENTSTEPILWECQKMFSLSISVKGLPVLLPPNPKFTVHFDRNTRQATADEVSKKFGVGMKEDGKDVTGDRLMPGYCHLAPGGRLTLKTPLSAKLKKPGRYQVECRLRRYIALNDWDGGRSMECHPIVLSVVGPGQVHPPEEDPTQWSGGAWGEAVEGMQIRLSGGSLNPGKLPSFSLDARNYGKRTMRLLLAARELIDIECDGVWYSANHPRTTMMKGLPFAPGNRWSVGWVPSSPHYWKNKDGKDIAFGPGEQTIRLAVLVNPGLGQPGKPVRLVTNAFQLRPSGQPPKHKKTPPGPPPAADGETPPGPARSLSVDRWAIRAFGQGRATKYEEMDRKVAELVAKYSDPDSQGQLYLEALRVHVMSGMWRPLESVKYAEKAEGLLTDPVSRAQLYISWGDVCQFKKPGATGKELQEVRHESATRYLVAMKVALDSRVPATLGERPGINPALQVPEEVLLNPAFAPGFGREAVLKARKMTPVERAQARQEFAEATKRYELHEALIPRREAAKSLVVYLYRKVPHDMAELRTLAVEILQDGKVAEDLVQATQDAIDGESATPPKNEFSNYNAGHVVNGPTQPSLFACQKPILITRVSTYHWNHGKGVTPGQISLKHNDGSMYGPWKARGETGLGGAKDVFWVVQPEVTLKPGTYTVVDSDPLTWSCNHISEQRGFYSVRFQPPTEATRPAVRPSSRPAAPPAAEHPKVNRTSNSNTAEAFLKAVLAGEDRRAATFVRPGAVAPKQMGALREFAARKRFHLARIHSFSDALAPYHESLAISSEVVDDRGRRGSLVLRMRKQFDPWRVYKNPWVIQGVEFKLTGEVAAYIKSFSERRVALPEPGQPAWGKLVNGLQAGLRRTSGERVYRVGQVVRYDVLLRNLTDREITVQLDDISGPWGPLLTDGLVNLYGGRIRTGKEPPRAPLTLIPAGKANLVGTVRYIIRPERKRNKPERVVLMQLGALELAPGEHTIMASLSPTRNPGTDRARSDTLRTGRLGLQVAEGENRSVPPPAKRPAADPAPGRIAELIAQLYSEKPEQRDKAQRELLEIGTPAVPALRRAAAGGEAKRARRARWVLAKIVPWAAVGVSGRVLEAPGGRGVAGILVTLQTGLGYGCRTRTAADGTYAFGVPTSSSIRPMNLWIEPGQGPRGCFSPAVSVGVGADDAVAADLHMRLPQGVSGTVYDARTGKRVSGARVGIRGPRIGSGEVSTDADGQFTFYAPPGSYTLRYRGAGRVQNSFCTRPHHTSPSRSPTPRSSAGPHQSSVSVPSRRWRWIGLHGQSAARLTNCLCATRNQYVHNKLCTLHTERTSIVGNV